jgi:hypothetical protein
MMKNPRKAWQASIILEGLELLYQHVAYEICCTDSRLPTENCRANSMLLL